VVLADSSNVLANSEQTSGGIGMYSAYI